MNKRSQFKGLQNQLVTVFVAIGLLLGASLAMAEAKSNAEQKSVEQKKLERLIHRYEVALNASDSATIMTLYSKTPVFMPQHSVAQVGRSAVKKAYENVFNAIDLNIKFSLYEIKVLGNTAWARTSSAGKTIILANGAKVNEGNNELFIFNKEKNEWKIHRYLFSTSTPR